MWLWWHFAFLRCLLNEMSGDGDVSVVLRKELNEWRDG